MKKLIYIALAGILIAGLGSCKTSEKNYRAAYERTLSADSSHTSIDQTIYGKYRREMRETAVQSDKGNFNASVIRVTVTKNEGALNENMKKYCVVAAGFKQLFNARSMRDRISNAGYPGAFLVQTSEPYYYVVAQSVSSADEAAEILAKLQEKPPFRLPEKPFVLCPAQLQ